MNYYTYIESPQWRNRRVDYFKNYRRRCVGCFTRQGAMQLHHRTYERLGAELDADLVCLCDTCHERVHHKARAQAELGVDPAQALLTATREIVNAFPFPAVPMGPTHLFTGPDGRLVEIEDEREPLEQSEWPSIKSARADRARYSNVKYSDEPKCGRDSCGHPKVVHRGDHRDGRCAAIGCECPEFVAVQA